MSVDVNSVLSGEYLTGVIRDLVGVPDDILPPAFTTASKRISGDSGTYIRVNGTARVAQAVQYGAPSKTMLQENTSKVPITLIHSFHHQSVKMATLIKLKNPEQNIFDQGKWEVDHQAAAFKKKFTGLRISSIYSMLATGKIYFDIDGNLLPSSSTAAMTVDFGVPAGNQDTIGGIIAAKWSTAGTDIIGQMKALKTYARKLTGYRLTTAFYGSGVPGYIAGNTVLANLIKNNAAFSVPMSAGEIPSGLLGIKNWIPFNEAYFVDSGNTSRDWIAADDIVFTPDVSPDWYECTEGSYLAPNSISLSQDGPSVLGNFTEMFGQFGYATVETDPPGFKQLAGDTFLPVLKVPKAIFRAGVDL